MAKQKKQRFEGIVYSTADDFDYVDKSPSDESATLENQQQNLRVGLDRKSRKGKTVTMVEGFVGRSEDLEKLAKSLKQRCGVGGGTKDGLILIQGDFKEKIINLLSADNYKVKGFGG